VSDVLVQEIDDAPEHVRDFFDSIPEAQIERIVATDESEALAEKYIAEGIVSKNHLIDCEHVALAAFAKVDVLVSFNCTHIVKLNRIRRYNAINVLFDLPQIEIRTPDEVIHDDI